MYIMALETSTESGSCALWQEGQTLFADCPAVKPHSQTLIPLAQQLLAKAGIGFSHLDAIAFDMGPGAFTGLRVACGIAQGMAVALGCPLIPVGSLETMAWKSGGKKVLSLLDARMGEIYSGAFERHENGVTTLSALKVQKPEALTLPEPSNQGWRAVGNALHAYPQIMARLNAQKGWECQPEILPHAKELAELAAAAFLRGETLDPGEAAPRYIRDKVASTVAERENGIMTNRPKG